jgi:hypothetical protein
MLTGRAERKTDNFFSDRVRLQNSLRQRIFTVPIRRKKGNFFPHMMTGSIRRRAIAAVLTLTGRSLGAE